MNKYKAYPEYRDSGVEWIGDLPKNWHCISLKYVAERISEKTESCPGKQYVGMENVESYNGRYIHKEDVFPEGLSSIFTKYDVLFGKLRPYLAKSWLAEFSGICSSEFLVLRSQIVYPKFLNYLTLIDQFVDQVNSSTYGSKMPRANWDFIGLMKVPLPTYSESEIIAKFLDHETAKIDTLIEKQKRLIELLKEKRQAVISHAVTKGLNPDAPMRDSGVEWLGEIPIHWGLISSKWFFRERNVKAQPDDEMLTASQKYGVISQKQFMELEQQKVVQVQIGHSILKRAEVNDFVISMRSFQGGIEYCQLKGAVSSAYVPLEPVGEMNVDYFKFLFKSKPYIQALQSTTNLVRDGQALRYNNFTQVTLPIVSVNEQNDIALFISDEIFKIDELVKKAVNMISILQERRTALISAAVTGKIDVRDWRANILSDKVNGEE